MISIKNSSPPPIISGYGSMPVPEQQDGYGKVDPEAFQRQCALLEQNEQAAKQRARVNEYWRQRTLARQMQWQEHTQSDPRLKGLAGDDYGLATMDSKHRTGKLLNVLMDEYNTRRPSQLFLDWVDSMTPMAQVKIIQKSLKNRGHMGVVKPDWVRAFNRGVRYMYAAERGSYQIQIKKGLLYQNDTHFDTGKMKTENSGTGVAIFIQSADGTFYSSDHVWGHLQHTSSTPGSSIRSAGEWKVENGKINWISGKCGHYKPTMDQLVNALDDLKKQNALTDSIARVVHVKNNAAIDIEASFLASNSHFFRVC